MKPIINILPKNKIVDNVLSYIYFLRTQHRIPLYKRQLINDELYKIKTGSEIENPLRVFTSDKEYVKVYVKAIVGDKYNVETIKVLRSKTDVDNYEFPTRCCIKPTHASGRFIIRRNGENLPIEEIKQWLDINYYHDSQERNYKNLIPKIIVEPLVFDSENIEDFKFFCYFGKVKFIQIDLNRNSNHTRKFYTIDWNPLDFTINFPLSNREIKKPSCLKEMINVCEQLSSHFSLVRVDLYTNNSRFIVGEITHCAEGGVGRFMPRESEYTASKLLFSD